MGACFGKPMECLMPPLDQELATASHSRNGHIFQSRFAVLFGSDSNSKMCQTVYYLPAVMK